MAAKKNGNNNGRRLPTQQSVDQAIKSICDIMRRGDCAGALQYVPELTWVLFLRILDEREDRERAEAEALGIPFNRPWRPRTAGETGLRRVGQREGNYRKVRLARFSVSSMAPVMQAGTSLDCCPT